MPACLAARFLASLTLLAASVGFIALGPAATAQAQDRVVNVYNWTDYIDPTVLDDFTRETGIRVVYDMYDNNEIVETKLLAGRSGYDVVAPSGPFLARLIRAGVFLKLEKSKLTNAGNIWPEVAARLATHDPGNLHAVNYMWGTTGIGINVARVRERLGPNAPLNSWDLLMKPEFSSKLKDCGINVLDARSTSFRCVMKYLASTRLQGGGDLRKARTPLVKVRRQCPQVHSSRVHQRAANGEICLAVRLFGRCVQARSARRKPGNVESPTSSEGRALMWFDRFAFQRTPERGERTPSSISCCGLRLPPQQQCLLCQRQFAGAGAGEAGDPQQSGRLSRRGDIPAALHEHRLRRPHAENGDPAMDARQDRALIRPSPRGRRYKPGPA